MLSENLEWFELRVLFCPVQNGIFIHFKALTILPIFITELGSKPV
jgi:hypothetical protein